MAASPPPTAPQSLPLLEQGDHLDQKTFHERYEAMPNVKKAELIQGMVFMGAAALRQHSRMHSILVRWLGAYEDQTPGVETLVELTAILGPESEPQPDICMIVLPEKGGQMQPSKDYEDYLEGPPELVVEVASSTESYDLHLKKADYERQGVREYLVVALRQRRIFWFVNRNGAFQELALAQDGFLKSEIFPGLWLDPAALFEKKVRRVLEVAALGLATPEHKVFAEELERR
jgi:Uma2 family endonuclease